MNALSLPCSNSGSSRRARSAGQRPSGSMPSSRARRGLTRIALSHEIFVIGSGHSCSQPLFAKRPSSNFVIRHETHLEISCAECGCGFVAARRRRWPQLFTVTVARIGGAFEQTVVEETAEDRVCGLHARDQ